jgi:hypothetical protein
MDRGIAVESLIASVGSNHLTPTTWMEWNDDDYDMLIELG